MRLEENRSRKLKSFVLASAALAVAPTLHLASAANVTWTDASGVDNNWQTVGNWTSAGNASATVAAGSVLVWAGTTSNLTSNNNLTSTVAFNDLVFNSGAAAYTLTGTTITVSASTAPQIVNNSTSLETLDFATLMLEGGRTINAATGPIAVDCPITGTTGGVQYGLATAGSSNSAVIINAPQTYTTTSNGTAGTAINDGTLQVGASGNLPSVTTSMANETGYVTLGSVAGTNGVLILGDSTGAVNQTVNSLVTASASTTASDLVEGGNPAAISTLNIDYLNTAATSTSHATFGSGVAGASAQNNLALTKSGAGSTVSLTAVNTYVGNTTIAAGTLALANGASIAKSPVIIVGLTTATPAKFDVSAITAGFSLASGQTLEGDGTVVGALAVASGSTLSPGDSPGTLSNTGNVTYSGGGSYLWQINEADGTQGADPGWDTQAITGTLAIGATSGSPFNIDITSLTTGDVAGPAVDFDPNSNYTWTIASATGGITGFDPTAFNLDTSAFANTTAGVFGITTSGNNLEVTYTSIPVPEPTGIAAVVGASLVMLLAHRRRESTFPA